jgi:hypothetical protein
MGDHVSKSLMLRFTNFSTLLYVKKLLQSAVTQIFMELMKFRRLLSEYFHIIIFMNLRSYKGPESVI